MALTAMSGMSHGSGGSPTLIGHLDIGGGGGGGGGGGFEGGLGSTRTSVMSGGSHGVGGGEAPKLIRALIQIVEVADVWSKQNRWAGACKYVFWGARGEAGELSGGVGSVDRGSCC